MSCNSDTTASRVYSHERIYERRSTLKCYIVASERGERGDMITLLSAERERDSHTSYSVRLMRTPIFELGRITICESYNASSVLRFKDICLGKFLLPYFRLCVDRLAVYLLIMYIH